MEIFNKEYLGSPWIEEQTKMYLDLAKENFINAIHESFPFNRFEKNIIRYSRLPKFEAVVTKLGDDRTWIRVDGREWLLDVYGIRVEYSDRYKELPVDFDWRKKYEEADEYIDNDETPWEYLFMTEQEIRMLNDDFEHGFSKEYLYPDAD